MGVIKKQSIVGSIYSYLGVLIGFVNTVLIMPKLMTTDEIGLVNILVAVSAVYAQFSNLGFTNVTARLFSYFRDAESKHHGFVFISVVVGLVGFTLAMISFFVLKPYIIASNEADSPLLVEYIYFLIPLIFFRMFFLIFDTYNKMLYDATTGTFLSDFAYRFGNLLLLGAYFVHWINFQQYVTGYVVALSFPAVYLLILLISRKQFSLKPELSFISPSLKKEMVSMGFYGIIGGLSGVAVMSIDKIMINEYFNLSLTGIYSVSFMFGSIILVPNRAISKISSTVIADAWKENDHKTINDIFYKSSITQFIAGCFLCVLLIANFDNIFKILPPAYSDGKWVIVFISAANLVAVSTGVSLQILATSHKYKIYTLFMALLIVLSVISNMVCIPLMGMTGAAVATLFSMGLYSLIRVIYMKRVMNLYPYRRAHLTTLLVSVVAVLAGMIIPFILNPYVDAVIRSVVAGLVFVVLIYLLKVSADVNHTIFFILKKLRLVRHTPHNNAG
jgi:O-antigen/teichoic acid export membrane protein